VPFSCLFIYACVRAYSREKVFRFPRWIPLLISGAALVCAWLFREQAYTIVVMLVFAFTCILLALVRPDLLRSRQFWLALLFSYGAFVIVNGVLTAVPVVTYNPEAIWGIRVITIPLEDFFYNFCLLTLNYLVFRLILDKGRRPSPEPGELAGPRGLGSVESAVAPYDFIRRRQERRASDDV
jgi:lycopene cyclase domain-containing protein